MVDRGSSLNDWVFLTYRLPREPSGPRLALWRKFKRLGVAQLADGLVAIPSDVRTREQMEWTAEEIEEAGGTAGVWFARPSTRTLERSVIEPMNQARAAEYAEIAVQAELARDVEEPERTRRLRKLRAQMRQVERRDFFRPPQREQTRQALKDLAGPRMAAASEVSS